MRSFEKQPMTCIDIYQALTEKRPYKDGMPRERSISIMPDMAQKGELNEKIVRDIDCVMVISRQDNVPDLKDSAALNSNLRKETEL